MIRLDYSVGNGIGQDRIQFVGGIFERSSTWGDASKWMGMAGVCLLSNRIGQDGCLVPSCFNVLTQDPVVQNRGRDFILAVL